MVRKFSTLSARIAVREPGLASLIDHAPDQAMLRYGSMTLPDGRRLEFLEQGHPKGQPVILVHSLITDVGLSSSATRRAVMAGLKFITPIRAGFGNSDPNPAPDIEASVENGADDLNALLEHLNIDQTVMIGGWASSFVQRFATRYPNKLKGMIILRCVPLWADSFLPSIRPRYRNILKSSIFLPAAVPYLAKLGRILMTSGQELAFARGMNRERERDLAALDDPDILETVKRSYHCICAQGTDTFVFELKTVHHDWSKDACAVRVPTTIIVEDDFIDYPQSAFEKYVELVPHARLSKVEGAGEYLYLTHFETVIEELSCLLDPPAT
ncbi:MAG: alpha/beta hydrolase [Parvularcula sp.]|jgi:pimeloyl-ACP methyl ester carboxylesterase|nr:alpha/beta hydrolase [Parvularcula sp.]